MLIVTRRVNETIHIGGNVRLMVTKIEGDQVKIGIEAPRDVPINRGELVDDLSPRQRVSLSTVNGA